MKNALSYILSVMALIWIPLLLVGGASYRETIFELENQLKASKAAYASTNEDLRICSAILELTLRGEK